MPKKPVRYNRHAKKRMKDRGVSESETLSVIEKPEFCEVSVKGRTNAFKFINERYLRVTFKEEDDHILVITVTIKKNPFKR